MTEPDTSLALYDRPMFYQPALGREFALKLAYRQRETPPDNTFPNFGPFWSGGWVEYVEVTPDFGVTDYTAYSATRHVGVVDLRDSERADEAAQLVDDLAQLGEG